MTRATVLQEVRQMRFTVAVPQFLVHASPSSLFASSRMSLMSIYLTSFSSHNLRANRSMSYASHQWLTRDTSASQAETVTDDDYCDCNTFLHIRNT